MIKYLLTPIIILIMASPAAAESKSTRAVQVTCTIPPILTDAPVSLGKGYSVTEEIRSDKGRPTKIVTIIPR